MRISKMLMLCLLFLSLHAFADNQLQETDIAKQINQYIEQSWDNLTRQHKNAFQHKDKEIIYLAQDEDINKVIAKVSENISPADIAKVEVRYLPKNISQVKKHGLLYLPYPYVVPGGKFDEMYGWDSYFIELGLLQNNRLVLAKNMVDNIIYEINHYGTILNGNRTYYLERSQPPLLTQMVLAYYEKTHDITWLKSTLPAINKLYRYWLSPQHIIPGLGLSRYYAGGKGPTPEEDPVYYKKAIDYYKTHYIGDYDKELYYDAKKNKLTELFYIADRTVRESGFDITAKYGPFGAGILNYAPVDLNVLLYKMEEDTSAIYKILGDDKAAQTWLMRAKARAKLINQYMWNESLGYYFDYNFKTHHQRPYVYATTFYPLWAGIASKEQAESVLYNLPNLLAAGGIVTSTYRPRLQWDAPFGWAPMQYFAVKGLERYGYVTQAKDIANRFINTVNKGFQVNHTIYEKYDVQTISIETGDKIGFGYSTNEPGFGWTNGVYLTLTNFVKTYAETQLVKSIS